MLNNVSLDRLKTFHAVYRHLSLQKAATELNVTRSALSQSLKALEEELRISLFLRSSKQFQPTAEARELYEAMHPLLSGLEAALEKMEHGRKRPAGILRIGAPMDFGSGKLTRIAAAFRVRHPEVSFELQLAVPVRQLELLCEGKLDLAFIDNGDVHAQNFPVSVQAAGQEEFVLAASRGFLERHKLKPVTLKSLENLPIVDYLPHAPVVRLWAKHHFGKTPAQLQIAYAAESVRGVLTALVHGMGVGVIPAQLLGNELKAIEGPRKPYVNRILIARRLGKMPSMRETEFLRFYQEQAQKM